MGNAISDEDSILQERATMTSADNSVGDESLQHHHHERRHLDRRRQHVGDKRQDSIHPSSSDEASFRRDNLSPYSPETTFMSDDDDRTTTTDMVHEKEEESVVPQDQESDSVQASIESPKKAPLSPPLPVQPIHHSHPKIKIAPETIRRRRDPPTFLSESDRDEKKEDTPTSLTHEHHEVINAEEEYSRVLSKSYSSDGDIISAEDEFMHIVASREDPVEEARRRSNDDEKGWDDAPETEEGCEDALEEEEEMSDESGQNLDDNDHFNDIEEGTVSTQNADDQKHYVNYADEDEEDEANGHDSEEELSPEDDSLSKENPVKQVREGGLQGMAGSDIGKVSLSRGSTAETDAETLNHEVSEIHPVPSTENRYDESSVENSFVANEESQETQLRTSRQFFPVALPEAASTEQDDDALAPPVVPETENANVSEMANPKSLQPSGQTENTNRQQHAGPESAQLKPAPSEDFSDIDLHFVEQYETTFDSFMRAHPQFAQKNPDLVNILRVAKLQKMLEATAAVETDLVEHISLLQAQKQDMTDYYYDLLRSSSRKKAAREIHLQHELQTVEQATRVMEGKLTWQFINKNATRAQKHARLVQQLSQQKMDHGNPLALLPDTIDTQAILDAVRAPASAHLTDEQKKDLQQFQVDNAFLAAEVTVLEKKLAYQQAAARKHTWVDAVFRRMDQAKLKKLKERYQNKLGVSF